MGEMTCTPETSRPSEPSANLLVDLFLELAQRIHEAGAPAHRIEDSIAAVAEGMGRQVEILAMPTLLLCTVEDNGESVTKARRVYPSGYNIRLLIAADRIVEDTAHGIMTSEQARDKLRQLSLKSYPRALNPLAVMVLSASMAMVFGGSVRDSLASAAIGLVIGLLVIPRWRSPHMLNVSVSCAAVIAASLTNYFFDISIATVALASFIVLVPGLTLTVGLIQLGTRHLVSGTAQIMAALIAFLELGFGAALGKHLSQRIFGAAHPPVSTPAPDAIVLVMLGMTTFSLLVLFNVPFREFGVVLASSAIAFFGARYGALTLDPLLGASVGSFAVGLFSNGYARIRRAPAMLPLAPAVLLLVPGSLGYRSLESFLAAETTQAIDAVFSSFVIGTSIVSGLLLANSVIAPRRRL